VSRHSWVAVASLVAISFASIASAEDGWSMSKLNPFKKASSSKRAHAQVSDESRGIGWPRMSLPGASSKPASTKRKSEPSTLAKVNKSTKDFFGKSKEVLMPWTKKPKKAPTHSSSSTKSAPKKSFLTSWMSPKKEEEKKPQTVTDFLKQDRPEF
jgi:hypothetical protein